MKVSGFTFIRNAIKYDYPVVESIRSILPICDELVVAVGNSEDETLELISSIDDSKIKIIRTTWNDDLRAGGKVLAIETDKAFKAISKDSDWAFYIQADEVIHEKFHDSILHAMKTNKDDQNVDGLLFNYLHFYGSYDYIADSFDWYRREIRVIKNHASIYSYKDAQGFRKGDNKKLQVKLIDADVYHYGWVKDPRAMQSKQEDFNKLWHDDQWIEKNILSANAFDYSGIDILHPFKASHPAVMKNRIAKKNWQFEHDISANKTSLKNRFKKSVEALFGFRIGEYQNYKII